MDRKAEEQLATIRQLDVKQVHEDMQHQHLQGETPTPKQPFQPPTFLWCVYQSLVDKAVPVKPSPSVNTQFPLTGAPVPT